MNHLDDVTGSIEPGKLADLVVIDRDVLDPQAARSATQRSSWTLVEGDAVHEDAGLEVVPG